MMTANEAREATKMSVSGLVATYCEKAIAEAVSQGKYFATIDLYKEPDSYSLAKALIRGLQKLGYKTDYFTGSQLDPCCRLSIEWK